MNTFPNFIVNFQIVSSQSRFSPHLTLNERNFVVQLFFPVILKLYRHTYSNRNYLMTRLFTVLAPKLGQVFGGGHFVANRYKCLGF